ncbi:Homeobox-leucine zipper protein ATHB-8 [Linum perenne]
MFLSGNLATFFLSFLPTLSLFQPLLSLKHPYCNSSTSSSQPESSASTSASYFITRSLYFNPRTRRKKKKKKKKLIRQDSISHELLTQSSIRSFHLQGFKEGRLIIMMAVTSANNSSGSSGGGGGKMNSNNNNNNIGVMDNGKYVRYTPEQVEALERLYHECPKPSSLRRQQLIRDCPILSHIEPRQIKVWFQNRRCREKQRKEASRLQAVNRKLTAMNKLLMEENDRLQKQVSHLVYENTFFRQHTPTPPPPTTTDTSCESVVTTSGHQRDAATPAGVFLFSRLLSIAEETLAEFLSKATGTAVEWVQMPGMKPGPDSIGIVAISHGGNGIAARACGLVGLEPTRVAEILKDRPSWYRDCRTVEVLNAMSTGNAATIELLYMQLYAPTTLAPARDFWLLRYTSALEDGSLVVCERSLNNTQNGPSMPPSQHFVRAQMFPSGYLIRPCDGGGSIIHVVDHMDLEPWSVPEVLRPLYESSTLLAQKTTMAALRHLRQISQEVSQPNVHGWGRRPAALRALGQRLSKGFNEAVNGFTDEGWSVLESDGIDDVTVLVNSSPTKMMGLNFAYANGFPAMNNAVLCAKASMLLQNVPPAVLLRFLREHRSEWADSGIDAYAAAAVRAGPCGGLPVVSGAGNFGGQVILPLAHTIEHEEFMEVIKLENMGYREDMMMPGDIFLLQLCNGVDENAVGNCAELIFAPIDASFSDDAPIIPSGFRIIPVDPGMDASSPNRTLDLASALEVGRPSGNKACGSTSTKSVMTIAFQFGFEMHLQENVASMARQYVRSIIASVQRVAMALSPSGFGSQPGLRSLPGSPEALTLARWISQSYSCYLGAELLKSEANESVLKALWHHSDSILCCSLKALPVFTFANQAGLDMLETTMVALQDITLEKIFDENGRKHLCSEFPQIMQQGFMCLQGGVCMSSMGRPVSYERAVAWKVLNDDEAAHCICFMFINWSFV